MKRASNILSSIVKKNLSHSEFKNSSLSYCQGPTGIKLLKMTIGEALEKYAKKFPSVEFVVSSHQNERMTYEQFDYNVNQVSKSLLSLNLEVGSKIGLYAPNSIEWVLVQYACAKLGFILVNINPAYQVHDLTYVLNKVGVNCLIMPNKLKSSNYIEILSQIAPELNAKKNLNPLNLNLKAIPSLKQIILLPDSGSANRENELSNKIIKS